MYPGSAAVRSNGGVNNRTSPSSRRTRYSVAAAMAVAPRPDSAPPEITAHDWAIESIRHSEFEAEPSGVDVFRAESGVPCGEDVLDLFGGWFSHGADGRSATLWCGTKCVCAMVAL